ncbi:synaptonemal complex protein 3 [Parasteatoda tepidariorum]|uniref:synaptonemal complex protein 3 n=1 Tax=Parasteatoda tepidariorum TaxID=114398 RepID=UPI00077FD553|nr:synaptonemal complex protein 3 [Parasteatoda tepidariorum]
MPRNKAENGRKTPKKSRKPNGQQNGGANSDSILSEEEIDEIPKSPDNSDCDSKKSLGDLENESNYPQDFGGSMSKLLEKFSTDMNKTMQAKRRKLEQFTQESTRSTTKKVLETNKSQSNERKKLIDQYQNQLFAVIQQGETEVEKMKEAEDKLQKVLVQQQKQQQQIRIAHSQRLKVLKNLSEEFCKGMTELEESHVEQYSAVHGELRKEMGLLQKKILMDIQQQEMMNVRKQLKQLLP